MSAINPLQVALTECAFHSYLIVTQHWFVSEKTPCQIGKFNRGAKAREQRSTIGKEVCNLSMWEIWF